MVQAGLNSSPSLPAGEDPPCQRLLLLPGSVKPLPCPLLSNLASRSWRHNGGPLNSSLLLLPEGELVLVGTPEQAGRYECWSQEGGFRQLMASYCVRVEQSLHPWLVPAQDPSEILIGASRSTSVAASGGRTSLLEDKTYWTEFLVMCLLFGLTVVLLTLFLLHRHQRAMKTFLKQGRCSRSPARKRQKPGRPLEGLPLNGASGVPSALPDHKGYQALNDSHVASTPVRDGPGGTAFLEPERRPLGGPCESFVEVVAPSQRPRVRLGSEIRDSVV